MFGVRDRLPSNNAPKSLSKFCSSAPIDFDFSNPIKIPLEAVFLLKPKRGL